MTAEHLFLKREFRSCLELAVWCHDAIASAPACAAIHTMRVRCLALVLQCLHELGNDAAATELLPYIFDNAVAAPEDLLLLHLQLLLHMGRQGEALGVFREWDCGADANAHATPSRTRLVLWGLQHLVLPTRDYAECSRNLRKWQGYPHEALAQQLLVLQGTVDQWQLDGGTESPSGAGSGPVARVTPAPEEHTGTPGRMPPPVAGRAAAVPRPGVGPPSVAVRLQSALATVVQMLQVRASGRRGWYLQPQVWAGLLGILLVILLRRPLRRWVGSANLQSLLYLLHMLLF